MYEQPVRADSETVGKGKPKRTILENDAMQLKVRRSLRFLGYVFLMNRQDGDQLF